MESSNSNEKLNNEKTGENVCGYKNLRKLEFQEEISIAMLL